MAATYTPKQRTALPFSQTRLIPLPSGTRVYAARPSVITLIRSGGFPTELTGMLWRLTNKDQDPADLVQSPEDLERIVQLIDTYIPHVQVQPEITLNPDTPTSLTPPPDDAPQEPWSGVVNIRDMTDPDKQFLFLYGQGLLDRLFADVPGVHAFDQFRAESERATAGPAGASVSSAPVADSGSGPAGPDGAEPGPGGDVPGAASGAGRPEGSPGTEPGTGTGPSRGE